jgi:hypothetical protein
MQKKDMFKKEGKLISFPGTRDFNPVTNEAYTESEAGIIVTPEAASEAAFLRMQEQNEKDARAVDDYNKGLVTTDFKEFENIKLIGSKVLFRPFKHTLRTKGGLHRKISFFQPLPNTETVKEVPLSYPLQYRGVICKISDECPEEFKSKVKVGDIADIQSIAWQQQAYVMDRDLFQELEEPFTFWLTPGHIQAIIENYEVK